MTIDEAIRLLQKDIDDGYFESESSVEDAAKLGIEALKLVKELQHHPYYNKVSKLPGETEE